MRVSSDIISAYESARKTYSEIGVDTNKVISALSTVSISLQCWQGDDVGGFEKPGAVLSGGGIQVTGNYPGKARNIDELRMDLDKAYSLIPGKHRLNLHAIYGEFKNGTIDRDEITPDNFKGWVEWADERELKIDFNATCFSHRMAESGYTLSSRDKSVREFWIEHVRRCREISAYMGKALHCVCIHNLWIPDGSKDIPVDRWTHREILKSSLDEIFRTDYKPDEMKDALESKLFGIGSESYVVGSHEFYIAYAQSKGKMVCLDMGHYHPTESVADKISSLLIFFREILIHVSRGVRWDSDHVAILNDDLRDLAEEIVRGDALNRVHIALDFFDAGMNRIGAWVIGCRAALKSILIALLEPRDKLREYENAGNYFARLALMEELKTMPYGAVWDYFCLEKNVPVGTGLIDEIMKYENDILTKRL